MAINKPQVKHKMGGLFDQREKSLFLINGRRIKISPSGRNDIVSSSHGSLNISCGLLIAMLIYKERAKYSTVFPQ